MLLNAEKVIWGGNVKKKNKTKRKRDIQKKRQAGYALRVLILNVLKESDVLKIRQSGCDYEPSSCELQP